MKVSRDKDWPGFMVLLDTHYPKPINWGLFKPDETTAKLTAQADDTPDEDDDVSAALVPV
jgi:hypothetical protein